MRKFYRLLFVAAIVAVLGATMGCGEHCQHVIREEILRGAGGGACLGLCLTAYRLGGKSCPVARKQVALAVRDVKCAIAGGLLLGGALSMWHVVFG